MSQHLRLLGTAMLLLMTSVAPVRADSVRVTSKRVQAGKPVWIVARGTPNVNVHFDFVSGTECGSLEPSDVRTNQQGEAKSVFTATDPPANCEAEIATTIYHAPDTAALDDKANYRDTTRLTVTPATPALVNSIDASTAITIILIASFAIDRLVTLLMALLPFAQLHRAADPEEAKRQERLTYISLAAFFGLLLGYFGDIHLLAGLGFSTNAPLNAIVTALILTAGSDSISALIKKMGGTSISDSEPKPLVVQGELTLKRPERSRAAAQGQND